MNREKADQLAKNLTKGGEIDAARLQALALHRIASVLETGMEIIQAALAEKRKRDDDDDEPED